MICVHWLNVKALLTKIKQSSSSSSSSSIASSLSPSFICDVNSNKSYYMASSARGHDEENRALWLVTRPGKMDPLEATRCIPQSHFPQKPYNKSFIDQVCSIKMAGYWPCSFFASLWTSTWSRSINTQNKNLANIQPSWPNKLGQ